MGPAALILQISSRWLLAPTGDFNYFFATLGQNDFRFVFNILLFAPLTEEFFKYLVVRQVILRHPDFDEPLDAMIYLIVSALGFAAAENLLVIFTSSILSFQVALNIALARFLSATFLHTLASGILGYFLALALLNFKKRKLIFGLGFALAVVAHSFYNFLAWHFFSQGEFKNFALFAALFLIFLAALVSWQFRLLKKQISICQMPAKN